MHAKIQRLLFFYTMHCEIYTCNPDYPAHGGNFFPVPLWRYNVFDMETDCALVNEQTALFEYSYIVWNSSVPVCQR